MPGRLPRPLTDLLKRPFICDRCLFKLHQSNPSQRRLTSQRASKREKEGSEQWAEQAREMKEGRRQSILSELEERGLVQSVVGERKDLDHVLTETRSGAYVGIDPTAPSLHVGHVVTLMPLFWMYAHGYKAITLLGGTTASIGDPTGRTTARAVTDKDVRAIHVAQMQMQLEHLWILAEKHIHKHGYTREHHWRRGLVNNKEWWEKLFFKDVMRELGGGVRIGPLLGRDNVKTRLESGDGMSFAEFAYPLMQTWDWWELYRQQGIQIQIGGSDQYGNILTGVEGITNMNKENHAGSSSPFERIPKPVGFTVPLLTTANGQKFGKSAGNAVWLSKDLTSTFELYQYFVRQPDSEMERLLKMFTFIPLAEINSILSEHQKSPEQRIAQHRLAQEFVELVHGEDEAKNAEVEHRLVFSGKLSVPASSRAGKLETSAAHMPSHHVTLPRSLITTKRFDRILFSAGLANSRSAAQRLINQGSVSVGIRIDQMSDNLKFIPVIDWTEGNTKYIINDDLIILRVGKWKLKIIKIADDEEFAQKGLEISGSGESPRLDEETDQRKSA